LGAILLFAAKKALKYDMVEGFWGIFSKCMAVVH
jgi:hypothetical protein